MTPRFPTPKELYESMPESTKKLNRHLLDEIDKPQMPPMDLSKPTKADIKDESDLQSLCEQELLRRDIAFLHLSPKAREKKGWPDLTFVNQSIPHAIELKSEAGKLSEDQEKMLARMKRNGWKVYVVRSFEDFVYILCGGAYDERFNEWE